MADYDSKEMARRGRIGAAVTAGRYDSRETTRLARETFRASFLSQADPDGLLPVEERQRRAEQLRRAHYLRMAHASVKARTRRAPDPQAA